MNDVFRRGRAGLVLSAVLLAALTWAAAAAPGARAITAEEELTRFGGAGVAAGQIAFAEGIASDATTGHIYVADAGGGGTGHRVSEFTPWGEFVKAFGWDVAPGPVNEVQEVRVRATSGQFTLTFEGATTADISFDAPASGPASVESALDALPTIGGAGKSVAVRGVAGTPDGETPYIFVITFHGFGATPNVPQLTIANGTTPLSGTSEATTRANGTAGGEELESCTSESGCKAGAEGSGPGQFAGPAGPSAIAVASNGNLYVRDSNNSRIQEFTPSGEFILTFGGGVDKTTNGNICTKASGNTCGAGNPGTGPGEISGGSGLAIAPDGAILVPDVGRVERFSPSGQFESAVAIAGPTISQFAVDPVSGDFFATLGVENEVREFDPTSGAETCRLGDTVVGPVMVDSAGNIFTVSATNPSRVAEFSTCPSSSAAGFGEVELLPPPNPLEERYRISSLGTNSSGDVFVGNFSANQIGGGDSFVRIFGPPPVAFEGPPKVAPTITAQFASSVTASGAVLGALINPHFWTDTRYYVEYGTGQCSAGGCPLTQPLPPGSLVSARPFGSPRQVESVHLEGLSPGTTYHYRVVAQSSGGGPVFGVDPDGEGTGEANQPEGQEATFTTLTLVAARACGNTASRIGPGANLPDCRAYEMVSPIDKNGGDIKSVINVIGYSTSLSQSSPDGTRFAFSSYRSFGTPEGSPFTSQYVAQRVAGVGWNTVGLSARPGEFETELGDSFENQYKAFSSDLCSGWLISSSEPPLAPGVVNGHVGVYRREACGSPQIEAMKLPTTRPGDTKTFGMELQGIAANGEAAVVRADDQLTPEAASGVFQTYYATQSTVSLICILPNAAPSGTDCSAGTAGISPQGETPVGLDRRSSVSNALSSDGDRIYWTAEGSGGAPNGSGTIYLRLNPGQPQSPVSGGECSDSELACTVPVSGPVSTKAARFLGASPDGNRALFQIMEGPKEGTLYLFEVGGQAEEIAAKSIGVAGASTDLSRIYFVSESDLDESGPAQKGKPNLYLDEEGSDTYIATLSSRDVQVLQEGTANVFNDTSAEPVAHVAQASPTGATLVFVSTQNLVGYDNTDLETGRPDSEVYVYRVGDPGPLCISCNPGGARPNGRLIEGPGKAGKNFLPTAGFIPAADFQLSPPKIVSADGTRVFFDNYGPLVPRDRNAAVDVYEWEAAASRAACEALGAEVFSAASGGCLSLISSGESPQGAELLDASVNGNDVFFTTTQSLLPQDPGLIDVYDARVEGGLPIPSVPVPCQGEQCQASQGGLSQPGVGSAVHRKGNVKHHPKCPPGKRKVKRHAKTKCVKSGNKKAHHHKKKKGKGHKSKRLAGGRVGQSDGGAK